MRKFQRNDFQQVSHKKLETIKLINGHAQITFTKFRNIQIIIIFKNTKPTIKKRDRNA